MLIFGLSLFDLETLLRLLRLWTCLHVTSRLLLHLPALLQCGLHFPIPLGLVFSFSFCDLHGVRIGVGRECMMVS
jgi:hypothetical protein